MAIGDVFGQLAQQTLAQSPRVQPLEVAGMLSQQIAQQQQQRQRMQLQQMQQAQQKAAADEEFAFKAMETVAGAKADVAPLMVDLLRPLAQRRGMTLDFSSAVLASKATEASATESATRAHEYKTLQIQQEHDYRNAEADRKNERDLARMNLEQAAITARSKDTQASATERTVRKGESTIIAAQQRQAHSGSNPALLSVADRLWDQDQQNQTGQFDTWQDAFDYAQKAYHPTGQEKDVMIKGGDGIARPYYKDENGYLVARTSPPLPPLPPGTTITDPSKWWQKSYLQTNYPPATISGPPPSLDASAMINGGQLPALPQGGPQMMPPPRLPTSTTTNIGRFKVTY